MTIETLFSVLAFSAVIGAIGYLFGSSRIQKQSLRKRILFSTMLETVKEQIMTAHINAVSQNLGIMQFDECEFEFAIETEQNGSAKMTVYALEISGGSKQTDSNKVRIKYKALPNIPLQAPALQQGSAPKPERQ
jgi:hypothetical protein